MVYGVFFAGYPLMLLMVFVILLTPWNTWRGLLWDTRSNSAHISSMEWFSLFLWSHKTTVTLLERLRHMKIPGVWLVKFSSSTPVVNPLHQVNTHWGCSQISNVTLQGCMLNAQRLDNVNNIKTKYSVTVRRFGANQSSSTLYKNWGGKYRPLGSVEHPKDGASPQTQWCWKSLSQKKPSWNILIDKLTPTNQQPLPN